METTRRDDTNDIAQLAARCKAGGDGAYAELVDMYSGRFYGYFYSLTKNRQVSEDLLSDLYLKIFKSISSCDSQKFEAWMFKVASNLYYDYLRKKIRRGEVMEQFADEAKYSESNLHAPSLFEWDELHAALEKLDSQTRELVMLKYFSQMSFKEIAQERQKPIGTILSKVHRGVVKLRELIEQNKL